MTTYNILSLKLNLNLSSKFSYSNSDFLCYVLRANGNKVLHGNNVSILRREFQVRTFIGAAVETGEVLEALVVDRVG